MLSQMPFSKLIDFCRSELFLALAGGFAIGAALMGTGLFEHDAELPMAASVSSVADQN